MRRERPTIAPEIIACLTEGRSPTVHELCKVADHIQQDLQLGPSAFSWGGMVEDGSARLIHIRIALVALGGSMDD